MSEQKVLRRVEQRIVIKFLVGENVPSAEIHQTPTTVWGRVSLTDPCITIKELGAMLSISVGSVQDIVKYHLHYRKVNARWVPRTLTDVNKMVRMQVASRLLQQFEDEGDAFFKSIVSYCLSWRWLGN
ncbi:hypothetical protein B7P43_G06333 [Cryptotermes secundus]|uniref:Mos1 transposase HTH domain-containing protein n=1 Tax=Cryptotermes secundus TaxID=105785 RepID=A0A2J7PEQ6_9NEOP|nr:hypothetical protein B7P43_G06333 [Cryptotermes secundus]